MIRRLRRILIGLTATASVLTATPSMADSPANPPDTVEAFHWALKQGDGHSALAFLATDATIYEQGFVETSRDDWGQHQLADANRFATNTDRKVVSRASGVGGTLGWVTNTTLTTGDIEGRKLALEGTETVLLRLDNKQWKITHIHWSAHPREDAAAAP